MEKENVTKLISNYAWTEISDKIDIYVPNFNENYNNGALKVKFTEYCVDGIQIYLIAILSLDYWYDMHSLKQMNAICNANINRESMKIIEISMENISLVDIKS